MQTCRRLLMLHQTSADTVHLAHRYLSEACCGVAVVSFMQLACNFDVDAYHLISMSLFAQVNTLQSGLCKMSARMRSDITYSGTAFYRKRQICRKYPIVGCYTSRYDKRCMLPTDIPSDVFSNNFVSMYTSTGFGKRLKRTGDPARLLL